MKKSLYTVLMLIAPFLLFSQNVGIGIDAPEEKLHVDGNIKVSGTIKGLSDPINGDEAANKSYVDAIKESFNEDLLDAGLNGMLQDIDGNKYKTIKIGNQVWMAENLKTTRYNDGTPIQKVSLAEEWDTLTRPAYCWYDNDSIINSELSGALYNFFVVADTSSLNVCPVGWSVPTDSELTELELFLEEKGFGNEGSGPDIAKALASEQFWIPNVTVGVVGEDPGTNNLSGFSEFPSGYRKTNGDFALKGNFAFWWSSTIFGSGGTGRYRYMLSGSDTVTATFAASDSGMPIRCLRD